MTAGDTLDAAEYTLMHRASLHPEGCLPVSPMWNPVTVEATAARLMARGIFEERPAKFGRPKWRQDAELGPISLVLTVHGREVFERQPPERVELLYNMALEER